MTGKVIYEVNLTVDIGLQSEYSDWLQQHIQQMLAIPGFISAQCFQIDEPVPDNKACWTVHYLLQNQTALDDYLKHHAPAMRADGVKHFADRFSASRRIYRVC